MPFLIAIVDTKKVDGKTYYSFPSINALSGDGVEAALRQLGFGYRAAYIVKAAELITANRSTGYLDDLRSRSYEEAKTELLKLPGVGSKVADCVCLMSLDKLEAVPVDTHVRQIAERDYKVKIATTSLTDASYKQIGDYFRELWGSYAGWAQSVVFSADLKKFQDMNRCQPTETKSRKSRIKSA